MGSISLACVSLWLLRNPSVITIVSFPFMVGAAVGQLFGRPLVGVVAVAGVLYATYLLLLTIAFVSETGVASFAPALIAIVAAVVCLAPLAIIRRWNGRRKCLENE